VKLDFLDKLKYNNSLERGLLAAHQLTDLASLMTFLASSRVSELGNQKLVLLTVQYTAITASTSALQLVASCLIQLTHFISITVLV